MLVSLVTNDSPLPTRLAGSGRLPTSNSPMTQEPRRILRRLSQDSEDGGYVFDVRRPLRRLSGRIGRPLTAEREDSSFSRASAGSKRI